MLSSKFRHYVVIVIGEKSADFSTPIGAINNFAGLILTFFQNFRKFFQKLEIVASLPLALLGVFLFLKPFDHFQPWFELQVDMLGLVANPF